MEFPIGFNAYVDEDEGVLEPHAALCGHTDTQYAFHDSGNSNVKNVPRKRIDNKKIN